MASARVVAAAATTMISVFSGFMAAPDLSIKMPGLGLATAIALDAFVVSMTLVPAVLDLLGRSAWWLPTRLQRVLSRVDPDAPGVQHTATPQTAAA